MSAQTYGSVEPKQLAVNAAPIVIVALAGLASRTSLAAAYPTIAVLLLLWIVSDTMLLALMARSPARRPAWGNVLGALAAASVAVALGSPTALRGALWTMPAVVAVMAGVVAAHTVSGAMRAGRVVRSSGIPVKDRWIAAGGELLPPALVRLAAAELSLIHMAIFRWGGPGDVPAGSRAFPYHKHLAPMCATLLSLQVIEMAVYHLLVGHWSRTAALVMFAVSDIGLIYLVGLIKSFRFRPVLVTTEGVHVRAGFLIDRLIPFHDIAAVETSVAGTLVRDPATLNAALLAWPNIVLRLNKPVARHSLVRKRGACVAVAFRLDDPEPFVRLLRWRLGQR